jgi:predicted nuclease of restriction endonuclease-like (RecB) superfamily
VALISAVTFMAEIGDGWVIVQPNVYRFAVVDDGQFAVRTVIREYLATEVVWDR